MTLIDDIKRDRYFGTAGSWDNTGTHRMETDFGVYGDGGRAICSTGSYSDGKEYTHLENVANARRIARVPEMEKALIAAVELADAAESYIRHTKAGVKGETCPIAWLHSERGVEIAASAFRKALGETK